MSEAIAARPAAYDGVVIGWSFGDIVAALRAVEKG